MPVRLLYIMLCLLFVPFVGFGQKDSLSTHADTASFICILYETPGEFPGGTEALKRYLKQNIHFPKGTEDLQGRVVLSFELSAKGKISNIKVLRSLHPALDKVAVKAVKEMPRWKPGTYRGKKVRSHYTLPVMFKQE